MNNWISLLQIITTSLVIPILLTTIHFLQVAAKREIIHRNIARDAIPPLRKMLAKMAKEQNLNEKQIQHKWNV